MFLPTQANESFASNTIVLIDSAVDDYQTLAAATDPAVKAVIVLEPDQDGVFQITTALQQYSPVQTIHIVSHGSPGSLKLGNAALSLETIETYAEVLKQWSTSDVSLFLYGCNVAAGDAGALFIDRLHQLTGANIAASVSRTGSAALGGNWNLEVTVGEITPAPIFAASVQAAYASVLPFDSDDFNDSLLNPRWTFINPLGDSSFNLTGAGSGDAFVNLFVPAGTVHDLWDTNKNAPRIMQAATNSDFELAVKFASQPSQRFQTQGIIVEQNATNWMRFDTYHDGSTLFVHAASTVNGVSQRRLRVAVSAGAASHLRVRRQGNNWTLQYSADGNSWTTAGSFNHTLTVGSVGTFVANSGPTPAFTSKVDYFFNTALPINPEDGGGGGTNQPPIATNDSATVAAGTSVSIPVLNNDSDSDGTLVPSTLTIVNQPTNGTVSINTTTGAVTYSHNGSTTTSDSFTYTVRDNAGAISNPATVALTIGAAPPNQPPVANNDSATVVRGNSISIPVLNNDSDSDGTLIPSTLTIVNQPTNGTVSINSTTGAVTYTHNGSTTTTDSFRYTVKDNNGATSNLATVSLNVSSPPTGGGPTINVWYGANQKFGNIGKPQIWADILGNVTDPDGVASLTYSLNGGPAQTLSMGPYKRLLSRGDFNAALDFDDLNPTAVDDTIVITARDTLGNVSTRTVTVDYEAGNTWPEQYSVDWNSVSNIQDVAQVVDGLWRVEGDSIRTVTPGYDRLIAIGDLTWDDFEVTVPVKINRILGSTNGVGVVTRWTGHSDDPIAYPQPKMGWFPQGALGWFRNDRLRIETKFGRKDSFKITSLQVGQTYNFKVRAETIGATKGLFSMKVWQQGQAEPTAWDIQYEEDPPQLQRGSALLVAHRIDASFGDVTITPLGQSQLSQASFVSADSESSSNVVIGVDPNAANPGQGEIDTLTGFSGADTFILGDADKAYYNDGADSDPGLGDYALITDFNLAQQDVIQLHGSSASYQLGSSPSGLPQGTAIFLRTSDQNELIGVVQGASSLELSSSSFSFV